MRTPETPIPSFLPNSTRDQSVRRKIRPFKINEFGSGYQRNLHSPQGEKNNEAGRALSLGRRTCLPLSPSDSILTFAGEQPDGRAAIERHERRFHTGWLVECTES